MTTPIFGFAELSEQSSDKEGSVNDFMRGSEGLVAGRLAVTGDADRTIDTTAGVDEQFNLSVVWSGALTANRNLIVPSAYQKLWAVTNSTTGGHSITVKTAAGTGVAIVGGQTKLLLCDGTNVIAFS